MYFHYFKLYDSIIKYSGFPRFNTLSITSIVSTVKDILIFSETSGLSSGSICLHKKVFILAKITCGLNNLLSGLKLIFSNKASSKLFFNCETSLFFSPLAQIMLGGLP